VVRGARQAAGVPGRGLEGVAHQAEEGFVRRRGGTTSGTSIFWIWLILKTDQKKPTIWFDGWDWITRSADTWVLP
jgi:hypothetical protein